MAPWLTVLHSNSHTFIQQLPSQPSQQHISQLQISNMSPFGDFFSGGFGSDRQPSSRLTGSFDMPHGEYRSAPRQSSSSSSLRRSASQREPHDRRYNHRDLSPMRTSERPRAYTNKHSYADHRSVSPLGTSKYEQPSRSSSTRSFGHSVTPSYGYGCAAATSSAQSPASRYAYNETPFYGYAAQSSSRLSPASSSLYGGGNEQPAASGGAGLYSSSAVRGGEAPRRMGGEGEYGDNLCRERRPRMGASFRDGGFNWSDF
jgi:hypothetical protein